MSDEWWRVDVDAVNGALKSDEFTFADERHAAMLTALDLPTWTVGVGFGHMERANTSSFRTGDGWTESLALRHHLLATRRG